MYSRTRFDSNSPLSHTFIESKIYLEINYHFGSSAGTTSVTTAASGAPFTYFVDLKYTASRARAFVEKEREKESVSLSTERERERERERSRPLKNKSRGRKNEERDDDSLRRRRKEVHARGTLDKCGSFKAPLTTSAQALAYFKYDMPAILQYAAEFAAADIFVSSWASFERGASQFWGSKRKERK